LELFAAGHGNPDEVSLWSELRKALQLGAIRDESGFCAPTVGCDDKLDPDDIVVTGRGVALRETPSSKGALVERLSHDVVRPVTGANERVREESPQGHRTWVHVATLSGRTGYVEEGFLRSPFEYRFYFRKYHGHWKLDAFAAGA
jgi:hypothetical protein